MLFTVRAPGGSLGWVVMSSASQAGRRAAQAGAGHLLLTHLLPGTDPAAAQNAAASHYTGPIGVAASGLVLDLP